MSKVKVFVAGKEIPNGFDNVFEFINKNPELKDKPVAYHYFDKDSEIESIEWHESYLSEKSKVITPEALDRIYETLEIGLEVLEEPTAINIGMEKEIDFSSILQQFNEGLEYKLKTVRPKPDEEIRIYDKWTATADNKTILSILKRNLDYFKTGKINTFYLLSVIWRDEDYKIEWHREFPMGEAHLRSMHYFCKSKKALINGVPPIFRKLKTELKTKEFNAYFLSANERVYLHL